MGERGRCWVSILEPGIACPAGGIGWRRPSGASWERCFGRKPVKPAVGCAGPGGREAVAAGPCRVGPGGLLARRDASPNPCWRAFCRWFMPRVRSTADAHLSEWSKELASRHRCSPVPP